MEIKLTNTNTVLRNDGTRTINVYECGNYRVTETKYNESDLTLYSVSPNEELWAERYCPSITVDDCFGELNGFKIQTTSYGALNVEELQKMMRLLNEAVEVVNALTERYVKGATQCKSE